MEGGAQGHCGWMVARVGEIGCAGAHGVSDFSIAFSNSEFLPKRGARDSLRG